MSESSIVGSLSIIAAENRSHTFAKIANITWQGLYTLHSHIFVVTGKSRKITIYGYQYAIKTASMCIISSRSYILHLWWPRLLKHVAYRADTITWTPVKLIRECQLVNIVCSISKCGSELNRQHWKRLCFQCILPCPWHFQQLHLYKRRGQTNTWFYFLFKIKQCIFIKVSIHIWGDSFACNWVNQHSQYWLS